MSVQDILDQAACISCLDSKTLEVLQTQLLRDIAANEGVIIVSVTALPVSPSTEYVYLLTAMDAVALAAPGFYAYDGSGWLCFGYSSPYDLGNLTGNLSQTLIPGLAYEGTVTGNITAWAVTMSRSGLAGVTLTNATGYTVAQPTMTGRTSKLMPIAIGWDDAAAALVKITLEDDGTNLVSMSKEIG